MPILSVDADEIDTTSDFGPPPDEYRADLTENAITVLKRRYLKRDEGGNILETPEDMFWRVACTIANSERLYNRTIDDKSIRTLACEFYKIMTDRLFMPNSPTLMNAGRRLGQLSACFVIPIDDSMESIFEAVKNTALIHKSGGGTGFSFSRIRPKSDVVQSTKGISSGPLSFMKVFDSATEIIKQGGTRRGANMGILRVDHPDIIEFIHMKDKDGVLSNFNISVAVDDDFMQAVLEDRDYPLINPRTGEIVEYLSAKTVFEMIAKQAHKNGEPGIIFLDRINRNNPTPTLGEIESTNPCGEQPLLPYESCNLGSINLARMTKIGDGGYTIDWDLFAKTIDITVRFLDNVIDANRYPLPQIEKMTKGNRKIGLGIMGFADLLYLLEIPYNSEKALETAEEIASFLKERSYRASQRLAEERGPFPNFKGSIYDKKGMPAMRNATVTTIAPTGTISIIAGCSSGIEPLFALAFYRQVLDRDKLIEIHPIFLDTAKKRGFYSDELIDKLIDKGSIRDFEEIPEDVRKVFVVSHDISPEWHIKMQSAFQKYIDNAVSKTINFPNNATVEDIYNSFILAYKEGNKGITVYRDGSRQEQVLNIGRVDEGTSDTSVKDIKVERVLKPRERPVLTQGETRKIKTGCGNLYVTINWDETGLCELFANMGKAGGCAASQTEALSRIISMCLRSGVEPQYIVKHLKGIRCHKPFGFGDERILSCADAIARALEAKITDSNIEGRKMSEKESVGACPDCGGDLVIEEGCAVCKCCGYSECS
ncbi:MAG: ribonucleotide-diphosphate reductase subunit alpha [Candidatus Coatesbacteria bacterium]|nr:MAG: ribonucleotide-diphosphate reductase subunit alpha [Candidatus Coatesbacteria bacterium]RLC43307.1 MAG: ribonucleotide-diphosphate reductase subunit alpha [Candidatus Coatesbacteria bacterium]